MTEKMIGIWVPEELWNEIKVISAKERKPLKKLGLELFQDYAKNHADGNPAFTLDQFRDPLMKAVPAMMRPLHIWQKYIDELTEKEYRDIEPQIQALYNKMNIRWKRGFD